jgi:protein-arginine kinase
MCCPRHLVRVSKHVDDERLFQSALISVEETSHQGQIYCSSGILVNSRVLSLNDSFIDESEAGEEPVKHDQTR